MLRSNVCDLAVVALVAAPLLGACGGTTEKVCSTDGEFAETRAAIGATVPDIAGRVRRDVWLNMPAGDVYVALFRDVISVTTSPNYTDELTSLQTRGFDGNTATNDYGSNFGERMVGFIEAPATGPYQFMVSGDNQVQFFLSTDETAKPIMAAHAGCVAANATLCPTATAQTFDWTASNSFYEANQVSDFIMLQQGKRYFFVWYHRENEGNTHAMVKWVKPGELVGNPASLEVVPGSALSYSPNLPVFIFAPDVSTNNAGTGGSAGGNAPTGGNSGTFFPGTGGSSGAGASTGMGGSSGAAQSNTGGVTASGNNGSSTPPAAPPASTAAPSDCP